LTFRIGKSLEKSTVVGAADERQRHRARRRNHTRCPVPTFGGGVVVIEPEAHASFTSHSTLKPSELFSFFVARLIPPIDRSEPLQFSE
jgi:hypothetical protein